MKRLRRPRWFYVLVSRLRGWWVLPCVNCGQEWTAWEWTMDGSPTTGKPGWNPPEFALCTECATATAKELRDIKPDWSTSDLNEYAHRWRQDWLRKRLKEGDE